MKIYKFVILILIFIIAISSACSLSSKKKKNKKSTPDNTIVNKKPFKPDNPVPKDGQTNVSRKLILSWMGGDPDGDSVDYDIFLGNSSLKNTLGLLGNTDTTSFQIPYMLDEMKIYYWYVVSRDSKNVQDTSSLWSFTTGETIVNHSPNKPDSPDPENKKTDVPINPTLSWKNNGDTDAFDEVLSFDIYLNKDKNPPDTKVVSVNDTSYTSQKLEADSHYFWQVQAFDKHGASSSSDVWEFFTRRDNNPPNKPDNPIPSNKQENIPVNQTFSWHNNGDPDLGDKVDKFEVYLNKDTNPPQTKIAETNDNSFKSDNLDSSSHYFWQVAAFDKKGEINKSNIWEFFTIKYDSSKPPQANNNPPYVPFAPSPLDGSINQPFKAVALSWTGGDPDAGDSVTYELYFDTAVNGLNRAIATGITDAHFDTSDLMQNKTYFWQINSLDSHGLKSKGSVWEFTTGNDISITNKSPYPPYNPEPGNGDIKKPGYILLTWQAQDPDSTDILSYDVFFDTSLNENNIPIKQIAVNISTNSIAIQTKLVENKKYFWNVIVNDNYGHQREGPVWEITTDRSLSITNNPPYKPVFVYPYNGQQNVTASVSLDWFGGDHDEDYIKYDVYFNTTENVYDSMNIENN
ncbi:MAG: hypothetical protein HY934_05390, partial [Candidatus Firestonebacteria bacterium]|nr:hypothetical protein [Candidatus Firestonebacteria bacterium]